MVFTGSGVVGTGKDLTLGELSVVFGITVERTVCRSVVKFSLAAGAILV
jgi:hypothetical protein